MQATRRFIQTIRFVLGTAVLLYLLVILRIPSSATPSPVILRALSLVAIIHAILIFIVRRIFVGRAENVLEGQPEDRKALSRLRGGYIVIYTISLSIALYGLCLHFFGFRMGPVLPFFVAGILPIIFLGPKTIPSPGLNSGSDNAIRG